MIEVHGLALEQPGKEEAIGEADPPLGSPVPHVLDSRNPSPPRSRKAGQTHPPRGRLDKGGRELAGVATDPTAAAFGLEAPQIDQDAWHRAREYGTRALVGRGGSI